jgi:RNA polymerase sigma-70 factor, ECF subfamily
VTEAARQTPIPSEAMTLARAAARGDKEATAKLLRAIGPRLARVVRAVLGASHPDLDDAIQLSLIGFVQALPAFRGECDPSGYATTIAVRTAVATRKRSYLHRSRHEPTTEALVEHEPSPSDRADAQRRKELVRDLLMELPSEQAETLAMRVVLGWSREEIAEYTGAPVNTVRSRMRLAKEALKKRIEADPTLLEALEVEPSSGDRGVT